LPERARNADARLRIRSAVKSADVNFHISPILRDEG
jgi:hypothetical protein